MRETRIKNPQIAAEAADWAVTLDHGVLPVLQKQQLANWLLQSPLHVEEFLIAATLFDTLEGIDASKSVSVAQLLANLPSNVVSMGDELQQNGTANLNKPAKRGRAWLRWFGLGTAASIALVLVGIAAAPNQEKTIIAEASNDGSSGFVTQLGEQRKMTLQDGSIIHVNTQSEVVIRYEKDQRVVELLRGEAMFEVAHNPDRPFRVIAGDTVAEAIGTTFNVYRTGDHTTVSVIEGKVAVLTEDTVVSVLPKNGGSIDKIGRTKDGRLLLAARQKVEIVPETKTAEVATANVKAVTSWQVGQLIFESEDLAGIAAQFNRYNRTRILITDDKLAATEFSGVFDADDPESLIAFLEFADHVQVDRDSTDLIKLSYR